MSDNVRNEIESRINYHLARGGELPKNVIVRDKVETEYQRFMSSCMKRVGGGPDAMRTCAAEWRDEKEHKQKDINIKTDILIVADGCDACAAVKDFIQPAITDGLIYVLDVQSDAAIDILRVIERLDDEISIPVYVMKDGDNYVECDIRDLMWEYGGIDG